MAGLSCRRLRPLFLCERLVATAAEAAILQRARVYVHKSNVAWDGECDRRGTSRSNSLQWSNHGGGFSGQKIKCFRHLKQATDRLNRKRWWIQLLKKVLEQVDVAKSQFEAACRAGSVALRQSSLQPRLRLERANNQSTQHWRQGTSWHQTHPRQEGQQIAHGKYNFR